MMTPEGAMRQAAETAATYFTLCLKYIESDMEGKEISDEVKFQCASRLALAASIDYATATFAGHIQDSPGISARVDGHIAVDNMDL